MATNKELILESFALRNEIKELENRKKELIELSKRRDEIGKLRAPLSRQLNEDYDWSYKQFRIGQFDEEKLKKLF